jgi:SPP1 gp7 family putative phage head morphogenesis protein
MGWAASQIGETLAEDLRKTIEEGFKLGESTDKIAKRVREIIADPVRARRIARTEVISAATRGNIEAWADSKRVDRIQFNAALDEKTCSYCQEFHGQVFSLGQEVPIPLHPQCRCNYLPILIGRKPLIPEVEHTIPD